MSCCAQCRGIEDMFGHRMAQRQLKQYRRKGPGKVTRQLIDAVARDGVQGRTFLDVGGGVGAIQHELMDRGAAGGTSADASPAYLAAARAEAEARGYDEVNLNVGCPSDRVRQGLFGACLMAKPELVAAWGEARREDGGSGALYVVLAAPPS